MTACIYSSFQGYIQNNVSNREIPKHRLTPVLPVLILQGEIIPNEIERNIQYSSLLASLNFNFLTCKMGIIAMPIPTHQSRYVKWHNVYKIISWTTKVLTNIS